MPTQPKQKPANKTERLEIRLTHLELTALQRLADQRKQSVTATIVSLVYEQLQRRDGLTTVVALPDGLPD